MLCTPACQGMATLCSVCSLCPCPWVGHAIRAWAQGAQSPSQPFQPCLLRSAAVSALLPLLPGAERSHKVWECPWKYCGECQHQYEDFILGIRENFSVESDAQPCHRLLRAVLEPPSLEGFKNHVDVAVGDMG